MIKNVIEKAHICKNEIACIGISNQREASAAWNRKNGEPLAPAVVRQCARAESVRQCMPWCTRRRSWSIRPWTLLQKRPLIRSVSVCFQKAMITITMTRSGMPLRKTQTENGMCIPPVLPFGMRWRQESGRISKNLWPKTIRGTIFCPATTVFRCGMLSGRILHIFPFSPRHSGGLPI